MRPGFIALLLSLLVLLSGCIQPQEEPEVSEKVVSEEWKPEGIVGENEYSRSMVLSSPAKQGYSGGEMEVFWKNDQEHLYMALKSTTDGWLSVGFEPSEWMKDADTIMGFVEGERAIVMDEYCTGNYGPHVEDTTLGGTNDILSFGGRREGGYSVIEFKRKLNTGDEFDKAFSPGQRISLIWATADSNDHDLKHNVAFGEAILALEEVGTTVATTTALSPREVEGMRFIWEEEKVARDLYVSLYEETNLSIFTDLARSEQNHMDQAKALLDKYGLETPVEDDPGLFANQTLKGLYDDLLAQGMQSPEDALAAAAAFEEISIRDLEGEISATESEDIRVVYEGLLAGSRKHLRSYVRDLQDMGMQYSPQYLGQEEFEETVT
ncbi:MAG TPA: DUF2202 domain-containing protein [Methanotrichaceae archaeon]|nr:DUF2202 domain-containing protein [Methanotrichaceae archaeon]